MKTKLLKSWRHRFSEGVAPNSLFPTIIMFSLKFFTPTIAFLTLFTACHAKGPVEPAQLTALINQADKIVVLKDPAPNAMVIFSSSDQKDIAAFNDAVTVISPEPEFHCMCIGSPAVRLYRGNTELVLITNHHGVSVRTSLWKSDAMLKNPEKWLKWFDAHQIAEPRKEVNEIAIREKQAKISYARWLAAMPKPIYALWTEEERTGMSPDLTPLREALIREFPDVRQRALVLFAWFGSGDGPWSGFPSYELVAENLLLDIPTSDLIATAQTHNLTNVQIEGAARLFGGWEFSQRRPEDLKLLPVALKKKLLEHSLQSTNEDKVGRAKRAFAQP